MQGENHQNRLTFLDGLRGFAILQVVIFHIWEISWHSPAVTLWGRIFSVDFIQTTGFLGVDLFLFLSSLCLFLPLVKNPDSLNDKNFIKIYMLKRATKILPSYFLALLVILTLAPPAYPDLMSALKDLFLHVTFLHPFDRSAFGSINGVFWTLGIEVQFYLLFPLIARAALASPKLTLASLLLTAQIYRLICFYFFKADPYLRNQLPGYLDIYGLGMATAWLMHSFELSKKKWKVITSGALSLVFTGVLFAVLNKFHENRFKPDFYQHLQFFARAPLALLFAGLVLTAQTPFTLSRLWLSARPLTFLGTVSYNWYIWHQFIAVKMSQAGWPQAMTEDPHHDPVWMSVHFWFACSLTLIVAMTLTYCVELPLIKFFHDEVINKYRKKPAALALVSVPKISSPIPFDAATPMRAEQPLPVHVDSSPKRQNF